MGTVHDLIRANGKEAALKADLEREVVEAAADYMSDEVGGISSLYAGWCMANLPHKRLHDDQIWEVRSENVRLVVEPGRRPARGFDGELELVGVPYGSKARLILIYLQTEALRIGTPEVRLGKSMRAWMARMGVSIGGTNFAMVREQAERISRCRLTFHVRRGAGVGLSNQSIIDDAMFLPADDGQGDLFAETARLSDNFFRHLKKHPVPVEESAVSAISNNSMALDAYVWLAYRLHALDSSTPVSWMALRGQFGLGVGRLDNFRRMFKDSLALAMAVYPDARVDVNQEGVVLHPSRPPVTPKAISAAV